MSLWFGQEWEIALSGLSDNGTPVSIKRVLDSVDSALVENVLHVDNEGAGWWLPSGGKFYRDASEGGNAHDEWSSPECSSPSELLRQEVAAERLVLKLAELAVDGSKLAEVRVSKSNVCGASGTSWGSHENYETSKPAPPQPMLAWLASRIAMTGAGGLDVTYPGIRFSLSPRAHFLTEEVNGATQWSRGIHNVGKAVPYGSRHRVHVIAGDGNRMPLSSWLRFGSTALVLSMLDSGPPRLYGLMDAVAAMHGFALDREFALTVMGKYGKPVSMLGLQRKFLSDALETVGEFPDWAPRVLSEWQRVLDALESREGWRALVGQLDWPTKLALFEKVLNRRGWNWERVSEFNKDMDRAWKRAGMDRSRDHANDDGDDSFHNERLAMILDGLLDPADVREFAALRGQLLEIDARYMQLGASSLFEAVSNPVKALEGVLEGLSADPLELSSPESGRAALRAKLVREHGWKGNGKQTENQRVLASWTRFIANDKQLAMPDVGGVENPVWTDFSEERVESISGHFVERGAIRMMYVGIRRAGASIDTGDYQQGMDGLTILDEELASGIPRIHMREHWRYMVRVLGRFQKLPELHGALGKLEAAGTDLMEFLWESCNARILIGLAGDSDVPIICGKVAEALEQNPDARPSGVACWKSHHAVWLIRHGRIEEAVHVLESIHASGHYDRTSNSVRSRIQAQTGECWRLRGYFEKAEEHFEHAFQLCETGGYTANLMDYVLSGRARKLADEGNRVAAYQLLYRTVLPYQLEQGMPSALRTFFLIARLMPERWKCRRLATVFATVTRLVNGHSGFASCPRVAKLIDHWEAWCDGQPDPDLPADADILDSFWGV